MVNVDGLDETRVSSRFVHFNFEMQFVMDIVIWKFNIRLKLYNCSKEILMQVIKLRLAINHNTKLLTFSHAQYRCVYIKNIKFHFHFITTNLNQIIKLFTCYFYYMIQDAKIWHLWYNTREFWENRI